MNLGENIYRLRTEKNMSQGDLADALEVSRQSVSKWENHNAIPDLDKVVKMAEIFGITLDELVTGEKQEPQEAAPVQHVIIESRDAPSPQRIIGIILLCFGLLFFLVLFWGASFSAVLSCLLLASPFIACGIICLKGKEHVGLYCLMTIYLYLWIPAGILSPNYLRLNVAWVLQVIHMLLGFGLVFWSWHLHRHRQFLQDVRKAGIYFLLLALTILITYVFFRFPGLLPTPGLLHS